MTGPEQRSPVTNVFGFLLGAAILLAVNVVGGYLVTVIVGKSGNPVLGLIPVVVYIAACIWMEGNGFLLSRLLCLPPRPGGSSLFSGVMYGLFGIAWHFIRASQAGNDAKLAASPKPVKRDSVRESLETVVFVVVLVLLLKLFVVEAFVIPTGSMAETLYGYHKELTCEQCGFPFEVNASNETESTPGRQQAPVVGYCCPNCRFSGRLPLLELAAGGPFMAEQNRSGNNWVERRLGGLFGNLTTSGDRVLVHKVLGADDRGFVVVFKYPVNPQEGQIAQNYIKRCMAFGGETVAIHRGELFVTLALPNPLGGRLAEIPQKELWEKKYSQFSDTAAAAKLFDEGKKAGFLEAGGFQLVRKPDDLVMAMRRIVYDNDYQPKDLNAAGFPARWTASGDGWPASGDPYAKAFKHTGEAAGTLRYRHIWLRTKRDDVPLAARPGPRRGASPTATTVLSRDTADPGATAPKRITNFLGYNAGASGAGFDDPYFLPKPGMDNDPDHWRPNDDNDHWVGDLMAECRATVAGPEASVTLDLAKGAHRYLAEFTNGEVRLTRTGPGGKLLATRPTPMTAAGTYDLRFANIDCRLRVWVNGTRIDFGTEADYPFETADEPDDDFKEGWTKADRAEPAAIHVRGDAEVAGLKLWRDTFYTGIEPGKTQTDFLYVQPGHYLCLGDNSSQSSDGRSWGVVPERLLLGRAVYTFFPLHRLGFIR